MGSVCIRNNSLGSIFILIILVLPNQVNAVLFHLLRSVDIEARRGGELSSNVLLVSAGILVPRYLMCVAAHLK